MTPSTVISAVPMAKFRFASTRRFTIGASVVSSRTTNATNPAAEASAHHRTQGAANQSTSCPLSRTSWSVPRNATMRPKPR